VDLSLIRERAEGYRSGSQRARMWTEPWAAQQLYCPACPSPRLRMAAANTPAYDLDFPSCGERFQLKSKHGPIGRKVMDSAHSAMIRAIRSDHVPGLIVLRYDRDALSVSDVLLVPRFFMTEVAIEKRKPLGPHARRAGWVGCNILLDRIPPDGLIPIVKAYQVHSSAAVRSRYDEMRPLARRSVAARGWTLDVLRFVRMIGRVHFTLEDIYSYEHELSALHPGNRHVRDKIRQQLQVLRDLGVVEFLGRGRYMLHGSQ
jgi:type II restriction enzyme